MNKGLEGPLNGAFEASTEGVIKQEFTTYRVRDDMLIKETTTRNFSNNGLDYHDTSSVEPLVKVAI